MNESRARLPRYQVSVDSYRSAKILLDQHGEAASSVAGRRMQELMEAEDIPGASAWADIIYALTELLRTPGPLDTRN